MPQPSRRSAKVGDLVVILDDGVNESHVAKPGFIGRIFNFRSDRIVEVEFAGFGNKLTTTRTESGIYNKPGIRFKFYRGTKYK